MPTAGVAIGPRTHRPSHPARRRGVYEFAPEDAYAVMTKPPGGATRWTF